MHTCILFDFSILDWQLRLSKDSIKSIKLSCLIVRQYESFVIVPSHMQVIFCCNQPGCEHKCLNQQTGIFLMEVSAMVFHDTPYQVNLFMQLLDHLG